MFRKARRCKADEPMCVEVAGLDETAVWVRNSQRPRVAAWFTREEWVTFTDAVKAGEFDLEPCPEMVTEDQLEQV